MTSEILIMKNDTIVMAADSAVTIGNRKTHTGANKLFGLSDEPPMAMMIFGTATFGSISLETLIKEYKKQTDFRELDDIIQIKENFIEYLNNIQYKISDFDYKLALFKENLLMKLNFDSKENIIEYLNNYKDGEILPFLENNPSIDDELEDIKSALGNIDIDIIKKYLSIEFVESSSGMVIAGFNKNEFHPSYIYFDLITKYENKIITYDAESYINSEKNRIVPFAQDDVTNTFISEISNEFIDFLEYYINNYTNDCSNEIIELLIKKGFIDTKSMEKPLEGIKKINEENAEEFIKMIKNYKENKNKYISDGIGIVSTDALVTIAENLIESTSIKRKLDSNLDSVGGDIDIIIITRDGLTYDSKFDCNKKNCLQNKEKS